MTNEEKDAFKKEIVKEIISGLRIELEETMDYGYGGEIDRGYKLTAKYVDPKTKEETLISETRCS